MAATHIISEAYEKGHRAEKIRPNQNKGKFANYIFCIQQRIQSQDLLVSFVFCKLGREKK